MADPIVNEIEEGGVKKEEKTDGTGLTPPKVAPRMRQIIIETDGNDIKIVKTEVSGKIELVAILQNVIDFIHSSK